MTTGKTSTERTQRWRQKNPRRAAEQSRRSSAKYRATAKGMLADIRYIANRRNAK